MRRGLTNRFIAIRQGVANRPARFGAMDTSRGPYSREALGRRLAISNRTPNQWKGGFACESLHRALLNGGPRIIQQLG